MSNKRAKLKEVATDAVQRSGLQNLSFRTLADQVGVKSSSVHYYFPEKADLAAALIENYTIDFANKLADIDHHSESVKEKLTAFIQLFEDVIKADKLCLCGMMAAEVSSLSDDSRALLSQYFVMVEKWLATLLHNHKTHIQSDFESHVLAQLIMSGLEGAILLDRVEKNTNRLQAQRVFILGLVAE